MSDEPFISKNEFAEKYGVSHRTIDSWVKKGRVERIQDVDLRACFHLLPEGSAPAAVPARSSWWRLVCVG